VFGRWVFFENLKEPHSLNFKNRFQRLKPKKCSISILWGSRCKQLMSESQSSDSGNRLAAIVSRAVISFPLHFKRIRSGMPISAISQQWEAYYR
jgi:hypothetical protein